MIISDLDFMEKVTVENERVNGGRWKSSFSGANALEGRNIGGARSASSAYGPLGSTRIAKTYAYASADKYSSSAGGGSLAIVF